MNKFLAAVVMVGFVLACDAARLNRAMQAPAQTANKSASMEKRQDTPVKCDIRLSTKYHGYDIQKIRGVGSASDCAKKCIALYPHCTGYTYNSYWNHCFPKTQLAREKHVSDHISGQCEPRGAWSCLGGDNCCSTYSCGEGEGDCDSDSDCARGLVCGTNNCGTFGDTRDSGFQSTDDCCEKRTGCSGGDSCCSNGNCQWGEGDCDSDDDCADGLYCGTDNCRHMNGERYTFDSGDDCCERKI